MTKNQLVFALLSLFLVPSAWATSGGLDKAGCHNSKKAGYHCHRAQPQSPTKSDGAKPAEEAPRK